MSRRYVAARQHVPGMPVWSAFPVRPSTETADRRTDMLRAVLTPDHLKQFEHAVTHQHCEALEEDRQRTLNMRHHAWMADGLTSAERKQRMIEAEEQRLQEYVAWCRRAATTTADRLFGDR